MPDVEVKINSMYPPGGSGGIRAYASATVDGCLGIRGIKVVEGGRGSHEPSSGAAAGKRTGAVPAAHADGRHVTQP